MIAKDLINYMIPPLRPEDDISRALGWMEELRIDQLPVLSDKTFQGFLSEETILNLNKVYEKVSEYELSFANCVAESRQHYYEVVRLAYENTSSLVAVVNGEEYLGVISVQDVVEAFAQTSSVNFPGGIIVITLKQIDYSLSEISRLIEAENAKILSSYVSANDADTSMIKLTLKLNKEDLSHITATLRRFDYVVEEHSSELKEVDDKERLEILMKYLKI